MRLCHTLIGIIALLLLPACTKENPFPEWAPHYTLAIEESSVTPTTNLLKEEYTKARTSYIEFLMTQKVESSEGKKWIEGYISEMDSAIEESEAKWEEFIDEIKDTETVYFLITETSISYVSVENQKIVRTLDFHPIFNIQENSDNQHSLR